MIQFFLLYVISIASCCASQGYVCDYPYEEERLSFGLGDHYETRLLGLDNWDEANFFEELLPSCTVSEESKLFFKGNINESDSVHRLFGNLKKQSEAGKWEKTTARIKDFFRDIPSSNVTKLLILQDLINVIEEKHSLYLDQLLRLRENRFLPTKDLKSMSSFLKKAYEKGYDLGSFVDVINYLFSNRNKTPESCWFELIDIFGNLKPDDWKHVAGVCCEMEKKICTIDGVNLFYLLNVISQVEFKAREKVSIVLAVWINDYPNYFWDHYGLAQLAKLVERIFVTHDFVPREIDVAARDTFKERRKLDLFIEKANKFVEKSLVQKNKLTIK